ncbi:hypothetical protein HF1_09670 [Mycoplasma haemofelis str. Langford 1]|uniref:Uncharacterized protein n=1 Tax=Mycoplasma haemofelis (strain Langford 1) TaxID=941640 RepID=E8ZIK4_MYCHL|nr:hypothetical protein [Mycoplasma haemofelis]CBY92975.1 hypothetical protein HF1_09670 [Mycoplasma haemofelis str. Langford 1]
MEPLKLAFLATGAGATGLGTYGLYSHLSGSQKENVGTRLVSESFELLNDSHKEQWKTSLEKYNEKKGANDSNIDETKLKAICKSLISKDKTSEVDYKKAKLYCVVPQGVSERLSKLGFKVLNTSDTTHQNEWTKLATSYITNGKGDKQIESLTLTTPSGSPDNNWSTLKENCKTILGKSHWEESFDSYFEKSKMWCTEEAFNSLPKEKQ